MPNPVKYERRMRDKAIAEKKRLITVDYDGRARKSGRATFQCVETPAIVKAVEHAIAAICKEMARKNSESTHD